MKDSELILIITRNCNGTLRKGLSSHLTITTQLQGHVLKHKDRFEKAGKKTPNFQSSVAVYFVKNFVKNNLSHLEVMALCSWGWKLDGPCQPKPFHDSVIMMKFIII